VGGTRPFPWRFLRELDFRGAVRELMRNIVNAGQLRFGFRVRRAMKSAATVLAANREVASDVTKFYGVATGVQLETGIAEVRMTARPRRDASAPLKVLWAGRLRSWKALPLLLRALAELPRDCRYTLRVMGQGNCRKRWSRLATQLGIASHVEWVGWPEYREQLPHYEWADVFAFTSLRDTSGTGLLEALAAGTPIIGVGHHGAADIMKPECAIATPSDRPRATIDGLSQAIRLLASDERLRCALSEGARRRARDFSWQRQWEETHEIYKSALASSQARPAASPSARRDAADERRTDEAGFQGMLTPQEAL
jgi:glycosyltransferase involved in cell wall biosynthesis